MSKKIILIFILGILLFSSISASRLPIVGEDNETWGNILNDYLIRIAGKNATELNLTMVSGSNIYSSAINSTHIVDGTIKSDDLANNSVKDNQIDYNEVTLSDFVNDENYLDKDEGGVINGSVVIRGNLSLIGKYFNASITNQYLNGSFFPDITNLFNLGSPILRWNNIFANNINLIGNLNASKIYSRDWSNVSITENQISNLGSYIETESDPLWSSNLSAYNSSWSSTYNETYHNYNSTGLIKNWSNDIESSSGIWTNESGVATYQGDVNITNNLNIENNITATKGKFEDINVTGTSTLGTMNLEGGNITAEYYCNSTDCYKITELLNNTNNEYTHLSNFTDDLGDRGYTSLSNFTNNQGYYNSSDFVITNYYNKTQVYNKTEIDSNNWINSSDISDSVGNWTNDKVNYYNKTEVDSNDNDTTYSAGSNLTLTDTTFSWNSSWVDNLFIRFSEIVSQVGNWTSDKSDYWNTSENLNTDSNINTTGNITASHFIGDGSQLTGIDTSIDLSDYWNTSENANANQNNITNVSYGLFDNVGIGTTTPQNELNVIGDGNFTGNLTIGDKLTFGFGEMIDNLVDGWLRVTGNLNVTEDLEVGGKINLTNSTYSNQMYTNENGTLIIKSQNGETRFY